MVIATENLRAKCKMCVVVRRLKATWRQSRSTAPSSSSTLAPVSYSWRSFTRLSGPDRNVLAR